MGASSRIDIARFDEHVARRLITRQEHPDGGLLIWNYTATTQYSAAWDDVTLLARGLITTLDGLIVARPFTKFFNHSEYRGPLPDGPVTVSEKLDGSLGILYPKPAGGGCAIATRGAFASPQALRGTALLDAITAEHGWDWHRPTHTYLFEVIFPENRIVVDYGPAQRLVLLAAIDTSTGAEDLDVATLGWPDVVRTEPGPVTVDELTRRAQAPNAEGYVVRFADGLRLKVKFDEYLRVHRLLTQVTPTAIWDLLAHGQPLSELVERVPDEFHAWVRATAEELQQAYAAQEEAADQVLRSVQGLPSRKEVAAALAPAGRVVRSVVFARLDGKPYAHIIWNGLKPRHGSAFRRDS